MLGAAAAPRTSTAFLNVYDIVLILLAGAMLRDSGMGGGMSVRIHLGDPCRGTPWLDKTGVGALACTALPLPIHPCVTARGLPVQRDLVDLGLSKFSFTSTAKYTVHIELLLLHAVVAPRQTLYLI